MLNILKISASAHPNQSNARLLIIGSLGLYLLFALSSLDKPLVDDEAAFRAAAISIAKIGKPICYTGTTPEMYIPEHARWINHSTPYPDCSYGLWHTPSYVYILGMACKFLGTSNWAFRLSGMLGFLVGWLILTRIIGLLFKDDKRIWITGIFSCLYFINPLLVQLGLLVDVDTTVVPIASYLFLHEVIRLEKKGTSLHAKTCWLSIILAISFWAKEFAGIYLAASLIGFNVLRLNWREVAASVGVFLGGAALFWGTWWVFCTVAQLPIWYFLQYTGSKLARGEGVLFTILNAQGLMAAVLQICSSLYYIICWQSPFYAILGLMAFGHRVFFLMKNRGAELIDVLWIYVIVIFGATQIYRPSILLRYAYPMHAVLLICIAVFLFEACRKISLTSWLRGFALALGISFLIVRFLGDPLLTIYSKGLWNPETSKLWICWSLILIFSFSVFWFIIRKQSIRVIATFSVAIGMLAYGLSLDWSQLNGYVTSFSYLWYGQRGNDEMSAYLRSTLDPNEMPVCLHDFGTSLNLNSYLPIYKWYTPDIINNVRSTDELIRNITLPEVKHILFCENVFRPDAIPIILNYYSVERQIGTFKLLRRTTSIQ